MKRIERQVQDILTDRTYARKMKRIAKIRGVPEEELYNEAVKRFVQEWDSLAASFRRAGITYQEAAAELKRLRKEA